MACVKIGHKIGHFWDMSGEEDDGGPFDTPPHSSDANHIPIQAVPGDPPG